MAKKRNPKGMGYYYKKDNLFCWRYRKDGREIFRSASTEKELQSKIRKVIGLPIINNKTTVREYFTVYLEEIVLPLGINTETGKPGATYLQYESIFRNHIDPVIGKLRLTSVETIDIQKVITKMNKKGLSTKTMKHAMTVMSNGFTRAFDIDKMIPKNPVLKCFPGEKPKIIIPEKQAKPKIILKVDDLVKFLKAMENSRWKWSVRFNLLVGLRRGELLALSCPKIGWNDKYLIINESYTVNGKGDPKSRKPHNAPLSNLAKYYLEKQIEMLIEEKNKVTFKDNGQQMSVEEFKNSDRIIFPAAHGDMISPNTYYHVISRFGEKAGLKAYPHCIRHTFVHEMRNSLSLKELQEALGHDESTTTLDIYGDMINDTTATAAEKIDTVFSGIEAEIVKKMVQDDVKKATGKDETPQENCKVIDMFSRRKVN